MSIAWFKTFRRTSDTRLYAWALLVAVAIVPLLVFDSPVTSRLLAVAGVCLVLWLLELVPAFVPTLLLWALIPATLYSVDSQYSVANTLRWAADPVLGLFFGGFALGIAAEKHGVSHWLARWAIDRSGGSAEPAGAHVRRHGAGGNVASGIARRPQAGHHAVAAADCLR